MVRTIAILTLATLATSHAQADEIAIKPKVIFSQMRSDADSISAGGTQINLQKDPGSHDTTNGTGFGVDFEFKLVDRAKLGSELSYITYDEDGSKATDMALGGFLAYDFIDQDNFTLYGKGGLSLHQYALEDFNSASLVNADLGLGIAFELTPAMDLGGEYKYTSTLGKGDMTAEGSSAMKIQNVSMERNDLSVFVAFKF